MNLPFVSTKLIPKALKFWIVLGSWKAVVNLLRARPAFPWNPGILLAIIVITVDNSIKLLPNILVFCAANPIAFAEAENVNLLALPNANTVSISSVSSSSSKLDWIVIISAEIVEAFNVFSNNFIPTTNSVKTSVSKLNGAAFSTSLIIVATSEVKIPVSRAKSNTFFDCVSKAVKLTTPLAIPISENILILLISVISVAVSSNAEINCVLICVAANPAIPPINPNAKPVNPNDVLPFLLDLVILSVALP